MSTAADYVGRTFDLVAFRGAKPSGDVLLTQALFGLNNSGEVCTGAMKVSQRWLLEFLTIAGSMTYRPERGTQFMALVRAGRLRSETDVEIAFQVAAATVSLNIRNDETEDMHPEDRFASEELLSLTLAGDYLELRVKINTLAGTDRAIILPIPLMPISVRI